MPPSTQDVEQPRDPLGGQQGSRRAERCRAPGEGRGWGTAWELGNTEDGKHRRDLPRAAHVASGGKGHASPEEGDPQLRSAALPGAQARALWFAAPPLPCPPRPADTSRAACDLHPPLGHQSRKITRNKLSVLGLRWDPEAEAKVRAY